MGFPLGNRAVREDGLGWSLAFLSFTLVMAVQRRSELGNE